MRFSSFLVGIDVRRATNFSRKVSSLHRHISWSSIWWTKRHLGLSVARVGCTPGSWMMRSKSFCESWETSSTAIISYWVRQSMTSTESLYRKKAPAQVSTSASGCLILTLAACWAVGSAYRTRPPCLMHLRTHLSTTVVFPVPGGPMTACGRLTALASSTIRSHSTSLAASLAAFATSSNLQMPCSSRSCLWLKRTSLNSGSSSLGNKPTSRRASVVPASSSLVRMPRRNRSTSDLCAFTLAMNVWILSLPTASSSKSARMRSSSSQ